MKDKLENDEIQIIGMEPEKKDAIKTLVEEKVNFIQTGVKKPTKVDDEIYEGLAKLFKSESKESEEKKSEEENLNSVEESSESEEEPYKNKTDKNENRPF